MSDKYRFVGRFYDLLGYLYTWGSMEKCKLAMVDHMQPGDRVLFAGVGRGVDAIAAARRGANVTAIDLSPTMLGEFRTTLDKTNPDLDVRMVEGDILKFDEVEQYDYVVANFFLNVFLRPQMVVILRQLIALLKPGGKLVIGDFAYPSGGFLKRTYMAWNWFCCVLLFRIVAGQPIHRIDNYPESMRELGLEVVETRLFSVLKIPGLYWALLGKKPAA